MWRWPRCRSSLVPGGSTSRRSCCSTTRPPATIDPAARDPDLRQLRRGDGRAQVQADLPLRLLPVLLRLLLSRDRAARPARPAEPLDWPSMTAEPVPSPTPKPKSGIPKNPGRRELGMTATLLFPNREIVEQYYVPIIYTACRTCYSEMPPEEIFRKSVDGEFDPAKMQKLIASVIESGHGSTIEHIVFTFAITGVSRTLSHQLVRHRAGVAFDQQSQRYVKFKGAATMLPALDRRGRRRAARALRDAGHRRARPVRRDARGGAARRGCPVRLPECHADEPRDDRQPAGADPHVGAAPVHDGPVGDPPALPADPPADLQRLAVPGLVPRAEVRAARLLRRVQQPRRPLPDPAAQGRRARRWSEKAAAARAAGRELPQA